MSAELRISPVLAGPDHITLVVKGAGLPAIGKQLTRALPSLDEQQLENFRRGSIDDAKLKELSDTVTDWLFGADLRALLAAALPANAGGLRLVVEVPDELRSILCQLPFELVWHDTPDRPLILRNDVQSLVYVLAKAPQSGAMAPAQNWPFKVLLVRAFPPDLDEVPEVAPLVAKIRAAGAQYGAGMVQVDVLSREPAIGSPATWRAFKERLQEAKDYNMLVFLGHGELVPSATGAEPIGQLFLESEDGQGSQAVSAPQLARLLSDCPVDVVVLAGCLTGADPPGGAARRRGGAQGVAQALVNSSEAGVEVAVAMRTELRTTAAVTFLERFFKSLLNPKPNASGQVSAGNIDDAVRAARRELFLDNVFPPQWAAPVVLRSNEAEPFIDYLAQPITFNISPGLDMLLEIRSTLWNGLADYSHAQGVPDQLQGKMVALAEVETRLRVEAGQIGPFIMPRQLTIPAGQAGEAVFELRGALALAMLSGRVVAAGGISVHGLSLPAAMQADFQLLADAQDPTVFELRSKTGAARALPEGEVLRATLNVGADVGFGVYRVAIQIHRLNPPSVLWPGHGIAIVPRP